MSADEKYGYVRGYLAGFQGGKRLACSFHAGKEAARLPHSLPPKSSPQQVCMISLPYLVETHVNAYVDTITNHYTKYSNDQEAEVSNVLYMMATPPGLTDIDQIHAKLGGDAKLH